VLTLVKQLLHCQTAGCLSALWFLSSSPSVGGTAVALGGATSNALYHNGQIYMVWYSEDDPATPLIGPLSLP
jgi:hypothetical protein